MKIHTILIFISSLLFCCHTASYGQSHSVGLFGSYNAATLFNFAKKDNYDVNYQLKSGFSIASFYETKLDEISNVRVELQYRLQNVGMEIYQHAGHGSYYKKLDYSLNLLNLNLIYLFRIVDSKRLKINISFGPTFSYNLSTRSKGNGWDYRLISQSDTLGNPVSFMTTENWVKDERNSKDFSKFNVGVDLGLVFVIPIRDQLDFLIQNRYNVLISNIFKMNYVHPTSMFTAGFQIGFRYNLMK